MSFRTYLAWTLRIAAVVFLLGAEPAINSFGKDPQAQTSCLREVVRTKDYIAATSEERRWLREDCHHSSLIEPFRFAYEITGFPSAE